MRNSRPKYLDEAAPSEEGELRRDLRAAPIYTLREIENFLQVVKDLRCGLAEDASVSERRRFIGETLAAMTTLEKAIARDERMLIEEVMRRHNDESGMPAADAAKLLPDLSPATIYRWRDDNKDYRNMYEYKPRDERPEWWEEKFGTPERNLKGA